VASGLQTASSHPKVTIWFRTRFGRERLADPPSVRDNRGADAIPQRGVRDVGDTVLDRLIKAFQFRFGFRRALAPLTDVTTAAVASML
jgi:hypothetical protein